MIERARLAWVLSVAAALAAGCGASGAPKTNADNFGWVERSNAYARPGEGGFNVRWSKQLTDRMEARFLPVELSAAGFDLKRQRVYIGTTEGNFFGFRTDGRRRFFYDAGAQVESQPAVDPKSGVVYFASVDGFVHALSPEGDLRWKTKLIGAIRTQPVLTDDALYLVSEADVITALAKNDGRILWTYDREPVDEITIAGHAGLLIEQGRLYAAFTDGAVAAIDPADGRSHWEIETALDVDRRPGDVPQFLDVDTTPVMLRGTLYVASFTAGLYALDPVNGSVEWRDSAFKGVTGLAAAGRMLVVASAQRGASLPGRTRKDAPRTVAPLL